jgi:putative polyketide hydroxylase
VPVRTSLLIVGGGLNGLSTALFLADRGVACVLVERHPTTSIQYKFRGISPRSMEIYRGVGLEAAIREHRTGDQKFGYIARTTNLADPTIHWMGRPWADTEDLSPTTAQTCDQDVLEPILKAHAERLGADVRFNTELLEFSQDAGEVTARIRDRGSDTDEIVYASYLVAADGAQGTTREKLGIERHGPGVLQHWMNVIFDTDLTPELAGRPLTSVFLTDINGTFVPREESGRWLMALPYRPESGERAADFTDEHCLELIRKAAGRSDIKARIVDARPWEVAAYVADRYREGRAFLVGDTAHLMPPTGGFSGNTGIHDAHNLAWKLDAVLRGAAGPRLLDSYDLERRPLAERTLAQALARLGAWFKDPDAKLPPSETIVPDEAVIFGHRYDAGAFVAEPDVSPQDSEDFENPREPSGRPGTRAAHLVVERAGESLSTLDLFGRGFVLLTSAEVWCQAAARLAGSHGLPLECYRVGAGGDLVDLQDRWRWGYGVAEGGAVLVRPDGFVAWRAREMAAQPEAALRQALATVLATT